MLVEWLEQGGVLQWVFTIIVVTPAAIGIVIGAAMIIVMFALPIQGLVQNWKEGDDTP